MSDIDMIRIFSLQILCGLVLLCSHNTATADPCNIPTEAQLVDTSMPDTVVGEGTPQSCTSEAFVQAVAGGGIITFDCGPEPITIALNETAKVFNNTLQVVSELRPEELSEYVRKKRDVVYDHDIDLLDVLTGLKLLVN